MAAPSTDEAPYKKDLVHNLGYNPIVMAYVDVEKTVEDAWLVSLDGWRGVPVYWYEMADDPDMPWITITYGRRVSYEYIDSNTIRFYGMENQEIHVTLFLEPRKDAWYE
jgi:hypothetical protein